MPTRSDKEFLEEYASFLEKEVFRLKALIKEEQEKKIEETKPKRKPKIKSTAEDVRAPFKLSLGEGNVGKKIEKAVLDLAEATFNNSSYAAVRAGVDNINRYNKQNNCVWADIPVSLKKAGLARRSSLYTVLGHMTRPELAEILIHLKGSYLTESGRRKVRRADKYWILQRIYEYDIV